MSSISMALAAARQASALGADAQRAEPRPQSASSGAAASPPVTPAKPAGTGLLVDTRA